MNRREFKDMALVLSIFVLWLLAIAMLTVTLLRAG